MKFGISTFLILSTLTNVASAGSAVYVINANTQPLANVVFKPSRAALDKEIQWARSSYSNNGGMAMVTRCDYNGWFASAGMSSEVFGYACGGKDRNEALRAAVQECSRRGGKYCHSFQRSGYDDGTIDGNDEYVLKQLKIVGD